MNDIERVLLIVSVTFVFVALITPLIRKIAIFIGAMDVPKDERRMHTKPMPKLGGLGIFAGFLLGYMLFGKQSIQMNSILIGGFVLIITGIIDDIKSIPALAKLTGQLICALIVVFYGNILLNNIDAFGVYWDFGVFSYPLTIFFIIGAINCINFIDGLDGLSSGVSSIYFLTIGIIALILNKADGLDITLTFIMLGSTLGFLVHNFYPAKIFSGDAGPMFLGYIIAVIALLGFKNVTLTSLFTPLLILAIPILDTFFAIVRRVLKGEKFSTPDKKHLHHQILSMRFSHRNTVLIIYGINTLFAIASIVYVLKDAILGKILYITLFVLTIWFVMTTSIISEKKLIDQEKIKEIATKYKAKIKKNK